MNAQKRLLEHYSALSPTLQAAARYILDHPNEVVVSSMRTLAERAGGLPATFVRLARQLGYEGWSDLRAAFVADLGLHEAGYGPRAESLGTRGGHGALMAELQHVLRNNLDRSFERGVTALPDAANLLREAAAIHIAGYRASAAIAHSLFYGLRLFRTDVHLLDGGPGGLEWQLRAIRPGDAVCAASFAPYSREALQALRVAKTVGAKRIALTDLPSSPLALEADIAVFFEVGSPSFFPSVTAATAMVEALLELVVAADAKAVAATIVETERALFASGAYLEPPGRMSSS